MTPSQWAPLPFAEMLQTISERSRDHSGLRVSFSEGTNPEVTFTMATSKSVVRVSLDDETFIIDTSDGFSAAMSELGHAEQRQFMKEMTDFASRYLKGEFETVPGRRWRRTRRIIRVGDTEFVLKGSEASSRAVP